MMGFHPQTFAASPRNTKKPKTSNFTSFAVKKKNLQKWFKRCFLENLHGVVLLTWREQFKFDMERKKLLRRKIGFFHFYQKMFGGYEWGKKKHLNLYTCIQHKYI